MVFDLADNLDKDKFEVEVACSPGGLLVEKLKSRNIKVHEIKTLRRRIAPVDDIRALSALKKLIKREKYDIVHCHSAKAGFLGRLAAKRSRAKKIYYTVHSWGFYNKEEYGIAEKFFIFLEKLSSFLTTKIVCVAEKVALDGIKNKIAKPGKFLVIPNGIDFNVENKREEIRKGYGLRPKEVVLGMVARLAYPKDPLLFLQLAKEVLKKENDVKFVLVGDGPLMDKCRDFVKRGGMNDKTLLLGEKSPLEARELFFAFDVFVLFSKFEDMPITILEAMFAGLPVIASNVGGINELIDDNQGGFLVKNNHFRELKEKAVYLIKNPLARKQAGEYNFQKAQTNFTLKEMIKRYENLYLTQF